ncbi:uncharacterized protein LOC112094160 isoform X3 [Morus notabilis]|uniref:uncharacterized protein LOC112094160 isoform X3 n=1 Tax=Morus notabilis TaxID=981085 RepID=UPI000CED3A3A|nr:uncharacterized protein LOC112094160 isoform X3 [Morus notabilis]
MQPQGLTNERHEVDSRRASCRRRGYLVAIASATAAAAFIFYDQVPRPMHNSSLRGIDKVNELLANNNEAAMFNKDCVGAIDGTHIPYTPIGVPNPMAYLNRKGVNSQNIMAACSFDMKFTYMLTGWEGSAHDARVLADAVDTPRFKFPHPPPGETYHLPDYQRKSGGFKGPRDIYNYKHSSL